MEKNLKVSPGWIDLFTSVCDPGLEHKEDLSTVRNSASAGGFTSICALPNTVPVTSSKNAVSYLKAANSSNLVQVLPIGAVTQGTKGEELTEMIDLHEAGAVAFSDGLNPLWHTDILLKSLQYVKKFGGLVMTKPEDIWLNQFAVMHEGRQSTILGLKGMPRLSEEIIVARDLKLLEYTDGRLHFTNISTPGALRLIKRAKKKGHQVTCDVAAHQLVFDDSNLTQFDSNYKVSPPFREKSDINALIKGLKDGVIDAICSSHQPQDEENKNLEFDLAEFGITGLQTVLPLLKNLEEELGWDLLTSKLSEGPRRILKLEQQPIEKGAVADLTVFDSKEKWTLNEITNRSKSRNTPLWEQPLVGKVVGVFGNKKYELFD